MHAQTKRLAESYNHCRIVARSYAKNFYYGFLVLPKPKRDALCAIYTFMRACDDLSDDADVDDRYGALRQWRATLNAALSHDGELFEQACASNLVLPAFRDAVERYAIPAQYFHELIDGAEMDLSIHSYATFGELYRYCYRVASTVGLTCIHVFGFSDERATQLAEWNGVAFQLTNILRDVREDAERKRVYLPVEDLQRFGFADAEDFTQEGLERGPSDQRFVGVMKFEAGRARDYYERARPLLSLVDADSRPALWAMTEIYRGLLERIQQSGFDVVRRRMSLPGLRKLAIMAKAWLGRNRFNTQHTCPSA